MIRHVWVLLYAHMERKSPRQITQTLIEIHNALQCSYNFQLSYRNSNSSQLQEMKIKWDVQYIKNTFIPARLWNYTINSIKFYLYNTFNSGHYHKVAVQSDSHVTAAQNTTSCRNRSGASVNLHINYQNQENVQSLWLDVGARWAWLWIS